VDRGDRRRRPGNRSVRANSYGEYVLPQRPSGTTQVTASCEGAKAETTIKFGGVVQQAAGWCAPPPGTAA
jgi:hypothetical protein